MLIRRSKFAIFYAGFCNISAGKSGPPYAFGHAPVDALDQHRELRRRQRDRAFVPRHPRPHEPALIEPLGEQAQPVAVPEQDLDDLRSFAPEGEQMAARTDPSSASPGPAWPVHPCPFSCRCNPAPGAPSRPPERSSSCSLPVENMLPNRFRIAAFGRKDASPVGQLHRHHPVRWMQQIVQHRGPDDPPSPSGSVTVASFAPSCRKPNWTRQRNTMLVTMRWRRQTSATLMPGCSDLQHDGELLFVREAAPVRASVVRRIRFACRCQVVFGERSLAALLAPVLICGQALG